MHHIFCIPFSTFSGFMLQTFVLALFLVVQMWFYAVLMLFLFLCGYDMTLLFCFCLISSASIPIIDNITLSW